MKERVIIEGEFGIYHMFISALKSTILPLYENDKKTEENKFMGNVIQKQDVPENWFELIDNVVDEYSIIGEDFKEAYRARVMRENEFAYKGYSFSRMGEIHVHYENGARRIILQGCSVKQMFLFLQILREPLKIFNNEQQADYKKADTAKMIYGDKFMKWDGEKLVKIEKEQNNGNKRKN